VPDIDTVVADGAHIINIHQANCNRYINYPFLSTDKLSAYAWRRTRRIPGQSYYTVRELNLTREMFAAAASGHGIRSQRAGVTHG
jgi:hypothetical protein